MRKSGGGGFFFGLCRPRHVDDVGVVLSRSTVMSPSLPSKRREHPTFMDELAAVSFHPEDSSFFQNDDTEPTLEDEDDDEEEIHPFEKAYRFWYAKGLLSFVPQSIQDEMKNETDENDWASFSFKQQSTAFKEVRKQQGHKQPKIAKAIPPPTCSAIPTQSPKVGREIQRTHTREHTTGPAPRTPNVKSALATANPANLTPSPKLSNHLPGKSHVRENTAQPAVRSPRRQSTTPIVSDPVSSSRRNEPLVPELNPRTGERRDMKLRSHSQTRSNKQLPPPRSKHEDCASCGSNIVTRVRCVQCKETVYCSMFCRGNDRYKHASVCKKLYCESVTTTTTTTPSRKTPKKKLMTNDDCAGPPSSWTSRVSVDDEPQPEAQVLRRFWEDRSNLEYHDDQ